MKRRSPLRRKAPLSPRPPTRSRHTPAKPRRLPAPDREFWQTQRAALYARSGGRCERCGGQLDQLGLEAHHRKLRSQGGGHGLENLLALCPGCHVWCHHNPAGARMSGWIVPSSADPAHRGVVLHDGRTVRLLDDGTYDICWDDSEEETA